MRLALGTLVVSACALFGQEASSPEMMRAQQEITRLRDLVAAGAVAPVRLQEAENALGDAKDSEILYRTLYGKLGVEDLSEEQSLEMVSAAERRLERQSKKIERTQKLVDAGVMARGELTALEEELESRKLALDLAQSRSRLLVEIAEMAKREQELTELADNSVRKGGAAMERFHGSGAMSPAELKAVIAAFERKFKRPLPISANGDTQFHRALGFDHRGRVDVALNPDTNEGAWLRSYLEANDIPYYAFRNAIPGKASGAHIHIGPGSTRLRAAD
jgi:hypothetical protein